MAASQQRERRRGRAEHFVAWAAGRGAAQGAGDFVRVEFLFAADDYCREAPEWRPVAGLAQAGLAGHEAGEIARARQVVVAVGLMNFTHLPRELYGMEGEFVTHSSQHSDLSGFKGRRVAVLGAGASAVDLAALLCQAGAQVELVARRESIEFNPPPKEPRSLFERVKAPRSGLGIGWRSRMCTDLPLVFYAMPESLRLRVVENHLGPAPCWFVRDAVGGHVPMHLGAALTGVRVQGGRVCVTFRQKDEEEKRIEVDHVIAATGYKVAISRLGFIDQAIQSCIRSVADTPILDRHFESSVPGLYFIGITAANSFGPLLRFAYGARFAARRVARRLGGN